MKALQITFLLIFGCLFSTQAIRHVHVYTVGIEESIVEFGTTFYEVQEQVRTERSTEELLAEYESTSARIEELRKSEPTKDQLSMRQENMELFTRHEALASELMQRQKLTREIRDLWIFSVAGLILIGVGSFFYIRGIEWVGMSLILPGLLELSWWSAPSFSLGGAVREYDILLMNKIILTLISFVLLYTLWFFAQRKRRKEHGANA